MDSTAPLLGNISPTNPNLMDKVFFGIGTLGAISFTIFQGVSIAKNPSSEKNEWTTLGISVALIGIPLFGLIRSFRGIPVEPNLKNLTIDIAKPMTSSDLTPIYKKINKMLEVKQLSGNIQIDFSEQENLNVSEILIQLDSLGTHFSSLNSIIQNLEKDIERNKSSEANQSKEILRLGSLLDVMENESKSEALEQEKKFECASEKELAQSKEITRLLNSLEVMENKINGKILEQEKKFEFASEKELAQSKEIAQFKEKSQVTLNTMKSQLKEKTEELKSLNEKNSGLSLSVRFYEMQLIEMQETLGLPNTETKPCKVEEVKMQLQSLVKNDNASGTSTGVNSTITSSANSPFTTPQNTPTKSLSKHFL